MTDYIVISYPPLDHSAKLIALQCFIVLCLIIIPTLIGCCCCCSMKFFRKDQSTKLFDTTTKFKIIEYKNIYETDRNYFKSKITTKTNTASDNTVTNIEPICEPNAETNTEPNVEPTCESNTDNTMQIISNVTQTVNISNEADEIKEEQKENQTNQTTQEPKQIKFTLLKSISETIGFKSIIPTPVLDIENNKKKYLLYKFNNLSDDDFENDIALYKKVNPFKRLNDFVNIVLEIYKPDDVEILLHISSPGGIAYLFEKSYLQLMRLNERGFRLTALVDDICASGGYMLASACHKIISSKYAQIGSVGVICTALNYHELAKKIGIRPKVFKTGKYKESFPTSEDFTDEDMKRMDELLHETLNVFKKIVINGRKMNDVEIEEILSARVWNGEDAINKKLVDEITDPTDYINDLTITGDVYVVLHDIKKKSFGDMFNISYISEFFMNHINPFINSTYESLKLE